MSSKAETLAKMLETWAVERRDAAKYHEAQGDFAISGSCEAQEDRLRQAAALIRELSGRVERLEAKAERTLLEVIDERDIAEASAQKLADLIARITDEDIGEHSAGLGCSGNDPILNAVDAAERFLALSQQKGAGQ